MATSEDSGRSLPLGPLALGPEAGVGDELEDAPVDLAGLAGAFDAISLLTLSLPTGLPRRFDSRLFLLGGEAGARMRLVSPFPLVALDHSSTCSLVALRVTSPLFPLVVFAHASTCSLVALWPVSP